MVVASWLFGGSSSLFDVEVVVVMVHRETEKKFAMGGSEKVRKKFKKGHAVPSCDIFTELGGGSTSDDSLLYRYSTEYPH